MKLFLMSNSTNHGESFLSHSITEFVSAMNGSDLTFVPYAQVDHDAYVATVRAALEPRGITVTSLHEVSDPAVHLATCPNLFVGGGNTFLLVKTLHDLDLVRVIRERVAAGMVYLGASAGTNISAPTMRTTNDMPIVEPASFETLGLVPFQINPHYLDADPASTHNGETRLTRLTEFMEHNDVGVLGLREGTWLEVDGDRATIGGASVCEFSSDPALYIRGGRTMEVSGDVSWLLGETGTFDVPARAFDAPDRTFG